MEMILVSLFGADPLGQLLGVFAVMFGVGAVLVDIATLPTVYGDPE